MAWQKLGRLFKVDQLHPMLQSHCANPKAIHLQDAVYRVFYSARNAEQKSSVSYVDIDVGKAEVVFVSEEPLLTFGESDSFYSHGISIGNVYDDEAGRQFIQFMGWQLRDGEHWRGEMGRAEVTDGPRLSLNPGNVFMPLDAEDSISLSYPFVIREGVNYRMWYGSTESWDSDNGEMIHLIKYATSNDGIKWEKHGPAIPFEIGVAQAFSSPSVLIDEQGHHMWFSYRDGTGRTYRIGYAQSTDGLTWTNHLNAVGIDVSTEGWDSEMICYPFVFSHQGRRYMLYNGNGYGREGFGLARWED